MTKGLTKVAGSNPLPTTLGASLYGRIDSALALIEPPLGDDGMGPPD